MSSHYLNFGWCEDCRATRDLTVHGKCGSCGSDAVTVRVPAPMKPQSVIDELLALESMFQLTEERSK